jgi:hypothetical protein
MTTTIVRDLSTVICLRRHLPRKTTPDPPARADRPTAPLVFATYTKTSSSDPFTVGGPRLLIPRYRS